MPRTIVLTLAPPNSNPYGSSEYWSVSEDGRICDGLCWDEMLGVVVRLTQSDTAPRMPMLTIDEHKARAVKQEQRRPNPLRAKVEQYLVAWSGGGDPAQAMQELREELAKTEDDDLPF